MTPRILGGKQLIQSYGRGRFRIAGETYEGSTLVFANRTLGWNVRRAEEISVASLQPVVTAAEGVRVLLIGCGRRFVPPPWSLMQAVREHGVVVEWMDTGAACRTFNVLLGEDREVAAALIAVD